MASSSRERTATIALVVIAAVLIVLLMAWALGGFGVGGMMGGSPYGTANGYMLIGVFIVLAIGGLLYLLLVPGLAQPVIPPPYPHPEWGSPPSTNPAVRILDERYARGEITREQYMQMRRDLESRQP